MVIIPQRLMMSAHHAKAGPERGHVHRDNAKLLGNDNGLALYIMQEMLKGEDSFYWPYLRVLPRPRNLRHWSEESLRDLQNQKAMRRTTARTRHLRALYRDTMNTLSTTYPDLYPVSCLNIMPRLVRTKRLPVLPLFSPSGVRSFHWTIERNNTACRPLGFHPAFHWSVIKHFGGRYTARRTWLRVRHRARTALGRVPCFATSSFPPP